MVLLVTWQDAIGFGGMKMIRRVVGVAHVEDLEGIADRKVKVDCESHAIALGRRLVLASNPAVAASDVATPGDLRSLAKSLRG